MSNEKDAHIIVGRIDLPTHPEKTRGELTRLQRVVETKILLGEEIKVVFVETN